MTIRARLISFVMLLISLVPILLAQDTEEEDRQKKYRQAIQEIDAELASALEALAAARERVVEERVPLATETEAIASELRQQQRVARLADQERDALVHELQAFTKEIGSWREEQNYLRGLLQDYARQWESNLALAELPQYRSLLESTRDANNDAGIESLLTILETSLARAKATTRGLVLPGEAVGEDGRVIDGTFVQLGPVGWFFARDDATAGLISEDRSLLPQVLSGSAKPAEVRLLAEGQTAALPIDPSGGVALALNEAKDSLFDHLRKGGIWMIPILLLAVVATIAAVVKWVQIARIRELRQETVADVVDDMNAGRTEAAHAKLIALRHPAGKLLDRAVELRGESKAFIEEALYQRFIEARPRLQRGLLLIAIASATAPLLGLLGTVTGIMHTFELINIFGTGDAKALSSGISEALITTEFGLVVAIPALVLHAMLSRKINGILSSMEMASLAFVNGLQPRESHSIEAKGGVA